MKSEAFKYLEEGISNYFVQTKRTLGEQYLLVKELIRDPRDMGTLCPSSRALSERMASAISPTVMKSGYCIELGAGTGPVTEALLKHGVPEERLIAVEKSELLAESLTRRFPSAQVLCCSAAELSCRIGAKRVRAIVSSLPFRSLPEEVGVAIMREVESILQPGGLFVQFTYALFGELPNIPANFRLLRSNVVLCNVPPARVVVFRKNKRADDLDCVRAGGPAR